MYFTVVCTLAFELLLIDAKERFNAETTPRVREFENSKPPGFPIAKTLAPTDNWSEFPNSADFKPEASIFNTAKSVLVSKPIIFAVNSLWSLVTTVTLYLLLFPITCAFVTT